MQQNPKQILEAARALIADPSHWTQGEMAKNSAGEEVPPTAPEATCWCSVGAIMRVKPGWQTSYPYRRLLGLAIRELYPDEPPQVVGFNDTHTHAEVLQVFDKAIENETKADS